MERKEAGEFFEVLEVSINLNDLSAGPGEGGILEISFSGNGRNYDLFLCPNGTWTWNSFPL